MATVSIEMDLPEGVQVRGYEHCKGAHAIEVSWDLPEQFVCEKCGHREKSVVETKATVQLVRDLDLFGEPCFFAYQPPYHLCTRCRHRQWFVPPFKRKAVTYSYRFEEHVLRLLIGSTEEEVARRLGITAETVRLIVKNQLAQERSIDPERKITDICFDELSLKKGHKLYVTVLTDLSDPRQPRILAVAEGKDQKAAEASLLTLSASQRAEVQTHRTDMAAAFPAACTKLLPNSQQVVDRFHVAMNLGKAVDQVRKKNDPSVQADADEGPEEDFPLVDVGVPAPAGEAFLRAKGCSGGSL